jgi:transposase
MTRSEREHLAKRIVQHYVNISNRQKKITVNHFAQEQVPRRTIYDIIKKFEEFGIVGDRPRSGPPKKLSTQQLTQLKRLTDQKTGISLRGLAPKFDVNFSTIGRNLKAIGIMYRKKKRAPKYTNKQLEEIPTRARRLCRTLLNGDFELVMDDEKYFLLHNESVPSNRGFYTSDPSAAPPEIKFKRSQKFEPKILVWIAISENGVSTPFFSYQQQAVNQTTYLNKCIKARLMPFIENYHNKNKVLFWPDLASSHYGLKVIEFFNENNISFVPKEKNPQNCPQARPIETFWSLLEQMVYAGGWEAKNIEELQRRISRKLKEFDIEVVQTMFSDISKQLRRIADKGPYGACSF